MCMFTITVLLLHVLEIKKFVHHLKGIEDLMMIK